MNEVNQCQVQLTNNSSTLSKCSMASKNYFKDDFIEEFVKKKKNRTSLIHMGYFTRAVIIYKLIESFIKFLQNKKIFKIISCGAGFDTLFWRLTEEGLLNLDSVFVDIDFPAVIKKKIVLINESAKLKSFFDKDYPKLFCDKIHQANYNYFLLEADLCDTKILKALFEKIKINYDTPTLFISECVITYMKTDSSNEFLQWVSQKFKNCGFINYEQIHPEDGFGKVMLEHFNKLQSSLFSVPEYPNCCLHNLRYKKLGFQKNCAVSEWDAFVGLTTENERKNAFCKELFDEFEEFHIKCVHYVVGIASNKILSSWINTLPFALSNNFNDLRKYVVAKSISSNLQIFRHTSCNMENGHILLLGGCSKQNRSSKVYKITFHNKLDVQEVEVIANNDVQLNVIYGNIKHFILNKNSYLFLYGGRTSPEKICNKGAAIIFQLSNNKLVKNLSVKEENLKSRFRSSVVSLNKDETCVQFWIFGGRTSDLNKEPNYVSDLWLLEISLEESETLNHRWVTYKHDPKNWPCSRMSHSMAACADQLSFYLSCGMKTDSFVVLNDLWKWSCKTESWQKINLIGSFIPRYGHSSHVIEDCIYLVGGVNTMAGSQPEITIISLANFTVTEYKIQVSGIHSFLFFNHTSEVIKNKEKTEILIIGGGGNCFSFGTYLNQFFYSFDISQLKLDNK